MPRDSDKAYPPEHWRPWWPGFEARLKTILSRHQLACGVEDLDSPQTQLNHLAVLVLESVEANYVLLSKISDMQDRLADRSESR